MGISISEGVPVPGKGLLAGMLAAAVALSVPAGIAVAGTTNSPAEPVDRAENIHGEAIVIDAHADVVLPSTSSTYLAADGFSKVDPVKLRAGQVDVVVMAIAVGPGPRTTEGDAAAKAEAMAKLEAVNRIARENPHVIIARTPAEVEAFHNLGQASIILGFQNARALGGKIGELDNLYDAGVRVFGLNHLGHNDFSDSSRPVFNSETGAYEKTEEHGGLSALGRAAVERINQLGGIIDVSQMSKAATLQTARLSTAPVIASHSNVRQLSNVTRNLSDAEIDLVGKRGGVIHIAAFGAYLIDLSDPELLAAIRKVRQEAGLPEAWSYPYELYWEIAEPAKRLAFLQAMRQVIGPGSVERMVDHVDYVVQRIGIDHVGFGTDFNHGGGVAGFTDASEALNVTRALVKRGYSDEDIAKIWGGNFLRVFAEVQRLADYGNRRAR